MKTSEKFLSLGILVIVAGIVLLVIGNTDGIGTSTFFFFPFFLVSTSDVMVMLLLIALTLFIFVIVRRSAMTYFSQVESRYDKEFAEQYIPVGTKCSYCSKPIPIDAAYCSSCGSPIDKGRELNGELR
ncbi:MAG: zinc ribbon domain-containing protein [Candidatus Thorarchaeota archaeon]|nr:MAG: zinc ribbon domain-containing protein [Candidatus Thorarchaeota archaeon]